MAAGGNSFIDDSHDALVRAEALIGATRELREAAAALHKLRRDLRRDSGALAAALTTGAPSDAAAHLADRANPGYDLFGDPLPAAGAVPGSGRRLDTFLSKLEAAHGRGLDRALAACANASNALYLHAATTLRTRLAYEARCHALVLAAQASLGPDQRASTPFFVGTAGSAAAAAVGAGQGPTPGAGQPGKRTSAANASVVAAMPDVARVRALQSSGGEPMHRASSVSRRKPPATRAARRPTATAAAKPRAARASADQTTTAAGPVPRKRRAPATTTAPAGTAGGRPRKPRRKPAAPAEADLAAAPPHHVRFAAADGDDASGVVEF